MVGRFIFLGIAQLASLTLASPLAVPDYKLLDRRAPAYCGSGGISKLAFTLSASSATPFCSSYLSIQTVTIPATETLQTYTTVTATVDEYTATTQTVATHVHPLTVAQNILVYNYDDSKYSPNYSCDNSDYFGNHVNFDRYATECHGHHNCLVHENGR
ncbi:hypothetical protein ABW20_dc0106056 [Dactylellina cionopaga]|nr:hypothetical protein ABW20_dc0106056 [Dactylellina cionopaga]